MDGKEVGENVSGMRGGMHEDKGRRQTNTVGLPFARDWGSKTEALISGDRAKNFRLLGLTVDDVFFGKPLSVK